MVAAIVNNVGGFFQHFVDRLFQLIKEKKMTETDVIIHIEEANFESTIQSGLVLIDFSAEWCGPCRALAPVLEEVATKMQGKVVVGKVDIDEAQATTAKYQVTSVPTLILFKDGSEADRSVGLRDADSLETWINNHM